LFTHQIKDRVISLKFQRNPYTAASLLLRWKLWVSRVSLKHSWNRKLLFVLCRSYKINHLHLRRLIWVKVYLGFKTSTINCKRLIKGLTNIPMPELSTILFSHLFSLFSFQRTCIYWRTYRWNLSKFWAIFHSSIDLPIIFYPSVNKVNYCFFGSYFTIY